MKKNALYLCFIFSGLFSLAAQNQTAQDTMIRRDLLLEKDYKPVLETAGKIYRVPENEDLNTKATEVRFSVTEVPAITPGEYVPLRAAEARSYFPAREQEAYVRLGAGYNWATLGDAQWNILKGPKHLLDLNAWHRSSFGNVTLTPSQSTRASHVDNRVQLNYQCHLNSAEFKAGLSEHFYAWNYYGRSWTDQVMLNWNKLMLPDMQWFSDTKLSLGFESKPWDKAFDYDLKLDGHYFRLGRSLSNNASPGAGPAEKELKADLKLNYQVNDKLSIGLDSKVRTMFYDRGLSSVRLSLANHMLADPGFDSAGNKDVLNNAFWFEVLPRASYSLGLWDFGLGLRISHLNGQKLLFAPIASVDRSLGKLAAFRFEVDGGQKLISYREGLELNPYLDPSVRLLPEYTPIALNGSFQLKPYAGLNLKAFAGYSYSKDVSMFYNAYPLSGGFNHVSYSRVFMAEYIKMNTFYGGLGFNYAYKKTISLSGKVSYKHYVASSDDLVMDMVLVNNSRIPWHRPAFEADAVLNVTPTDQTAFFMSYRWEGTRYAPSYSNVLRRLPDIHFLSLGGSYDISRRLGVFLHLDNVLNQFYEVWNAYPAQGFTAVIGASYSF